MALCRSRPIMNGGFWWKERRETERRVERGGRGREREYRKRYSGNRRELRDKGLNERDKEERAGKLCDS